MNHNEKLDSMKENLENQITIVEAKKDLLERITTLENWYSYDNTNTETGEVNREFYSDNDKLKWEFCQKVMDAIVKM